MDASNMCRYSTKTTQGKSTTPPTITLNSKECTKSQPIRLAVLNTTSSNSSMLGVAGLQSGGCFMTSMRSMLRLERMQGRSLMMSMTLAMISMLLVRSHLAAEEFALVLI